VPPSNIVQGAATEAVESGGTPITSKQSGRVMRKLLSILTFLAVGLLFLQTGVAAERASPQEAEAMLKKAIAHYQKSGKEKAFADFVKTPGPFIDRDLYVTVYNMKADLLVHINPRMAGKNMLDLRDADGKYFVRERLDVAQRSGKGVQDYKFYNPVSRKNEPKTMYFEKHDNLIFACGAYKPD